jgi:hypothetical protein
MPDVLPQAPPSVAHLRPQSSVIAARRFVGQPIVSDSVAYALLLNSVRLSDQAVREYDLARAALLEPNVSAADIQISFILHAAGHLEACLSSLERFLKHVKGIRASLNVPDGLRASLPRSANLLTSDVERRLTRIRHAIAHSEGEIQKGAIQPDDGPFLLPSASGFSLGTHAISWVELVAWLAESNSLSAKLALYAEAS